MEFKNIKGSGRGVTLRGDGTYQMAQDHTNFKLTVRPGNLSETPIYSLIASVLRPVASAFPIRVWGPLSAPEWALDFFTNPSEYEAPESPEEPAPPLLTEPELEESQLVDIPVGESLPEVDLGNGGITRPIIE